uniref:Uncharacterized protein n=1 Tax=Heliothis virescens TaxID=7102 RepID=A0A2A4JGT5_HELVI
MEGKKVRDPRCPPRPNCPPPEINPCTLAEAEEENRSKKKKGKGSTEPLNCDIPDEDEKCDPVGPDPAVDPTIPLRQQNEEACQAPKTKTCGETGKKKSKRPC